VTCSAGVTLGSGTFVSVSPSSYSIVLALAAVLESCAGGHHLGHHLSNSCGWVQQGRASSF
jgi:hypothetical protein